MSQFKRPFKVTLTDADGVLIDSWVLDENWVEPDGELTTGQGRVLGCEIADQVDVAAGLRQ